MVFSVRAGDKAGQKHDSLGGQHNMSQGENKGGIVSAMDTPVTAQPYTGDVMFSKEEV